MKPIIFQQIDTKAPINNPVLTGAPKAPTPNSTDNSTTIATTAFVKNNITDTKVTTTANTSSTKSYVTTCTGDTTNTLTYHTSVYVNHSTGVLMGAADFLT